MTKNNFVDIGRPVDCCTEGGCPMVIRPETYQQIRDFSDTWILTTGHCNRVGANVPVQMFRRSEGDQGFLFCLKGDRTEGITPCGFHSSQQNGVVETSGDSNLPSIARR